MKKTISILALVFTLPSLTLAATFTAPCAHSSLSAETPALHSIDAPPCDELHAQKDGHCNGLCLCAYSTVSFTVYWDYSIDAGRLWKVEPSLAEGSFAPSSTHFTPPTPPPTDFS